MFKRTKSQKGQATLEMVLILAVMISLSYLVLNEFKQGEIVHSFISKPWKTINGMIESGSWAERANARANHPNHFKRMYSQKGIDPN